MHRNERKGKFAAIKRAMLQVDTPVVVFSDANTMLNKDALLKMISHYKNEKVGGVAGEKKIIVNKHTSAIGDGEGLYWKYESFMKKLDAELYTVIGAAGELFSIRTSLFKEFPDDLIIDDFIISMQICLQGYRIAYEPVAYASELPSVSLAEEEKKKNKDLGRSLPVNRIFERMPEFPAVSHVVFSIYFQEIISLDVLSRNDHSAICFKWISGHEHAGPVFNALFLLQSIFYLMALTGWLLIRSGRKAGPFTVPFYFVFMNYCLVKGFFNYMKGRQTVLWEKSLRQAV